MPTFYLNLIFSSLLFFNPVFAQPQATAYAFDFGDGPAVPGYKKVNTSSLYSRETGFGFEQNGGLSAITRKGKNDPQNDFITASQPFFFSVQLPEGNYNVKVLLGDKEGESETIIRAECRRLMVEKFNTGKGKVAVVNFTINVRDSIIHGSGRPVRLKPREHDYMHWDNKLTLEFTGKKPKVAAIEIKPADQVVTVFLAGNSTVVDQASEPYAAWGQMIPSFFQPGKVAVCNLAESGEALNSFIGARRLEKALDMMKPGDYLFIEFAHNDQKQTGPGIGAFTSYKKDLKTFINEVRKKGGLPVLVTSMHRRNFDSTGKIVNTLGDYPAAMRQTAAEEKVPLIDLNNMSKILYESWGPETSLKAFVHYPANSFPGQVADLKDNTHFNPYGAYQIAKCISSGIRTALPSLARYLKNDVKRFDPARPEPLSSLEWPLSLRMAAVKPDGN